MSKIYVKTYTAQALANALPPLLVPNGKLTSFKIGFPSEGLLERVVVYQATGPSCAFQVELLNSQVPYPAGSYNSGTPPTDTLEPYRIQMPPTAPLSATAGNVITLADDDYGMGYRNLDGGFTGNQRYIYLVIAPVSAGGDTTWNVFLQCRTEVGTP